MLTKVVRWEKIAGREPFLMDCVFTQLRVKGRDVGFNYACAVMRMSYKMGSVSSFWCHICACKFMRAYIYAAIFKVGREVGDYLKYSPVAAKILLLCWENVWKDLKRQHSLKMYITMKYKFILHDKNIVLCYQQSTTHPMFQAP